MTGTTNGLMGGFNERTASDVRVEAEDRAGVALEPIVGEDVAAYREVMQRVAEAVEARNGIVDANLIAIEVLNEAVEAAHPAWDPYVHVGGAAVGIMRALREIGWSRL